MKRLIGYSLAVLLLLGAVQASAQTAAWTGDYYVVIGMNEKQDYAVTYGTHLKWHSLKAGPNFESGLFADLTLSPTVAWPTIRLSGRYEMLAVGAMDGKAYAVVGYEWADEPRFMDGMDPIANMTEARAVAWTGYTYVVLGRAMGGDGVLPTPRDAIAYGRPGLWQLAYLPFNEDLTFTHLAAVNRSNNQLPDKVEPPAQTPIDAVPPAYELLAVGTYPDGSAFAMAGAEVGGAPRFSGVPLPIPEIMNPVAVEWTGRDYIVVGERGNGEFGVMIGGPGRWARAEDFTLDGGRFTSLIVAPREAAPDDAVGYDLLAVGGLKGMAVSLPGREAGGMPVFDHGCAMIPEMRALVNDGATPAALRIAADVIGAPYPNPSAGALAFTVTLAREQAVGVAVLDVLGRQVAVLHDGLLAAGPHAFTLDGGALPDGTYFVRAQGEDFVQTRTVVLVR